MIDCFIFDFDGTLVHSAPAYLESFRHSIRLHTGVEVSDEEFKKFWHMNLTPEDILKYYGEEMLEEMLVSFDEYYYDNHEHHVNAYEGIAELLEQLRAQGVILGLVSLKPGRAGVKELASTGLGKYFRSTVWGDEVAQVKPHPEGLLRVLKELKVAPINALVIGDSAADILMGQAAQVRTAAALWGLPHTEKLLATAPDFVIDSPAELIKLL
ncbi:MAG: HAD-IA family hydrolase [Acidobacteria bacterium]|nr:HAD-IA family hydrolase [Acidobacteriota bacterium]